MISKVTHTRACRCSLPCMAGRPKPGHDQVTDVRWRVHLGVDSQEFLTRREAAAYLQAYWLARGVTRPGNKRKQWDVSRQG